MSTGQSHWHSIIEAKANMIVSVLISTVINRYLLPIIGLEVDWWKAFWITMIFAAISVIRNYVVRRIFNRLHVRSAT